MTATAEIRQDLNGVDVAGLTEIIGGIQNDPALGECQFRASNQWLGGAHNRSTIKDFYAAGEEDKLRTATFVFDNDEPAVMVGQDQSANPAEFLLHALVGCMTTTLVYHAAVRGIQIEHMESRLEGDLDLRGLLGISDDVRPGFQNIRAHFRIKANATAAELKELFKYSVVCDTVCHPVTVEQEIEMID